MTPLVGYLVVPQREPDVVVGNTERHEEVDGGLQIIFLSFDGAVILSPNRNGLVELVHCHCGA